MTTSAGQTPQARLNRLRSAILRSPDEAVALVRRELDDNVQAPEAHFDLLLLLTETYQQQGRVSDARWTLGAAVMKTDKLHLPTDHPRRATALAISADLAVWDGHTEAVQACTTYVKYARDVAADLLRVAIGAALRAVAIYHRQSCAEGRDLLQVLLNRSQGEQDLQADFGPLRVMAQLGYEAMEDGCRPSCQPEPPARLPPVPGGVLREDLKTPPPDYLATRVRRHSATHHTCDLQTA